MAGGTRRRQALHQRNKTLAIANNFDNYTIVDCLIALSCILGRQVNVLSGPAAVGMAGTAMAIWVFEGEKTALLGF